MEHLFSLAPRVVNHVLRPRKAVRHRPPAKELTDAGK